MGYNPKSYITKFWLASVEICKLGLTVFTKFGLLVTQVSFFLRLLITKIINGLGQLVVETPLGNMEQDFGHTFMIDAPGNISPLLWNAQYKLMGNGLKGTTV